MNELELSLRLYFMDGFVTGVKKSLEMIGVGLGMLKTGRLNPFGLFVYDGVKKPKQLQAMIKKARAIEDQRKHLV